MNGTLAEVLFFIDSNTLLYSIQTVDKGKSSIARDWLRQLTKHDAGRTNLQVLNESTNVLLSKTASFGVPDPFAQVDIFADFGTASISLDITHLARLLRRRYQYSWWDSILLASALDLECSHFLSEDLQDGQIIDGLTIVDPFRHEPDDFLEPVA